MILVRIIALAPHIHEVKLHRAGDRLFFGSFNVTELDGGRLIRTSALNIRDGSRPPGVHWWRDFAAVYFPRAEFAQHARLTAGGLVWREPIHLKAPQ